MPDLMTHLVQKHLQQSIHTFTTVLHDPTTHEAVVKAAQVTANSLKNGGKLLVCGNGGSAADAQHLVAEFVCRLVADRAALRAIALTTDSSILTSISNDYGYDCVFSRQVEALGQPGDVLLAISTSGNSPNCLHALQIARQLHLTTLALTGKDGGSMAPLADVHINVPARITANIQEVHLALEHIFCALVERCYFGEDFAMTP